MPTAPSPTVTHLMNFVPVAVALLLALLLVFISSIRKITKRSTSFYEVELGKRFKNPFVKVVLLLLF